MCRETANVTLVVVLPMQFVGNVVGGYRCLARKLRAPGTCV
jgi:hypothetical protein